MNDQLCHHCGAELNVPPFICPLHAAAPEMLEALRALLAEADQTGGNVRQVSRYEVDRARSAIAKAEGRTS